jgi:hypothetical protein
MGNEARFKSQFQFLETEFGLGLVGFHYDPQVFGNIVANYSDGLLSLRIVVDRGIPEAAFHPAGIERPVHLGQLLQELGAPPFGAVVYRDRFDSIGTAQGGDLPDLARVLREHLPAIREILVGRKGK